MYPVRYDLDIYTCANAHVAKQVRGLVKKGKAGKDLLAIVNKKDPTRFPSKAGCSPRRRNRS